MTLCYIIIYYINFILYYALLYDVYILLYLFQTISMTFSLLKNKHFSAFTHTLYSYVYIYRWFRMDRDRYMHAENVHAQLGRAPNTAQRLSRQRPPCWNHKPLWRCWSNSQTFERQVLRKSCRCRKFEQQTWPNTGRQGNDGIRYGKSQKLGGKPPNPAYPAEVEGLTKKFPRYQWVL